MNHWKLKADLIVLGFTIYFYYKLNQWQNFFDNLIGCYITYNFEQDKT